MRKKTVQTSSTKSSAKGNAKSNTKSNARNSVKSSVKSSAKNSPQKAVKNVAPTVENVSVKQAVIIQEPSVEQNEQNIPTRQPDLGPRRSVAFIGSECYPFVKTGGLGDVMSALPKSLAKLNIDVKVIIPRYKCIPQKFQEKMEYRGSFDMNLCSDGKQYYVGIMEYQEDGVVYDFIDNDEFFSWGNPYTNLIDDIPKFCYFAKAALAALNYLNWTPDVVHCHDWQAALVPLYLRTCFQDTDVGRAISVLTIHNLKFQGIYDRKKIQYWSGLPDYVFNKDCMIQNWLDANMLKGGIAYSNKVTTVSNTYAWEIQTEEYGEGLAEHLRYHNNKILGIVNGIDTDIWNPATDKLLAADYDEKSAIKNKKINKKALQESLGLDVDEHKMVIGLISRLTNQKGLDLVNDVIPGIMDEHTQVVVLGTGDSQYENTFRYYENKYKGNFCAYIAYNENVAHNIYAGCDALLVPSRFEPCGLTQLIAMRYGAVPIVRETGGLKDTVQPYNMFENTGNGYVVTADDLSMMPIYFGVDDENEGLCVGTENYWAVNAKASQEDIDATLEFLNWVITSDEGRDAITNQMGLTAPYDTFTGDYETKNAFAQAANKLMTDGKTSVAWSFNATPNVDDWRADVVSALTAYTAGEGEWDAVKTAFVDGWANQWKIAHEGDAQ